MKNSLSLLLTAKSDCAYLPNQQNCSLVVNPSAPMTTKLFSHLVQLGFRRSGDRIYRPNCPSCNACIPIRIPVKQFQANRSQRRNLKANADLSASVLPIQFRQEHYQLYQRYLRWRHADGQMVNSSQEDYREFFSNRWGDAWLVEFRAQQQLAAVVAVDGLSDGLSAVYTFYHPDMAKRGLGDYAVLWLIQYVLDLELDYLYLGYWVEACRKMAYKTRYRPFELYREGYGWCQPVKPRR